MSTNERTSDKIWAEARRRSYEVWQRLGMAIVLLILIAIMAAITPNFFTYNNMINVARESSINAILAIGVTFVILSGGIDLSVGSALAVTGAVSVVLTLQGVPSILAVLAGILLGGLLGALNGALIAKFTLAPFIVTLGALTYLRGGAYFVTGGSTVINQDLGFAFLGLGSLGPIPWPVVVAFIVFIAAYILLNRTVFGRHVYAIGGSERAARMSGINVDRTFIWVYVISGICAGIAGVIFSARLLSAQPTAGQTYELFAIAAVILGGTKLTGGIGSLTGTVIGALIIGVLNNSLVLLDVPFFYQLVITGVVVILAVLLDRFRTVRSE